LELKYAEQIRGAHLELDPSQSVGLGVVPHRRLEIFVPVGKQSLIRKRRFHLVKSVHP
jgi:hypothetical protein